MREGWKRRYLSVYHVSLRPDGDKDDANDDNTDDDNDDDDDDDQF